MKAVGPVIGPRDSERNASSDSRKCPKKRAAAQERSRRDEEEKQRATAQEQARHEAEQARIKAYVDSLSPEDQEALKAEALADANSFFVAQYRRVQNDPERTACYLKLILDTHVSGILAEQKGTGTAH